MYKGKRMVDVEMSDIPAQLHKLFFNKAVHCILYSCTRWWGGRVQCNKNEALTLIIKFSFKISIIIVICVFCIFCN